MNNALNTMTGKLASVSQVAQQFAGTLKSDVLNAVNSVVGKMPDVTNATAQYVKALQDTGPAAQQMQSKTGSALAQVLAEHQFTKTEIDQSWGRSGASTSRPPTKSAPSLLT